MPGGVIYPILFRRLLASVGFAWATRTIAFIMLCTSILPLICLRKRIASTKTRTILNINALTDASYIFFTLGSFFEFIGVYVVLFYVQLFAIQKTDVDSNLSFYLLPMINAGSCLGRLVPNFYADKFGCLNMQIPFAFISALLAFCWMSIRDTAGIVIFCLLYGFFAGALVSLPGPTMVSLSPDLSVLGTRMGVSMTVVALGVLIGNPVAGAFLRHDNGWIGVQSWCGGSQAVAGILMLMARIAKTGPYIKKKI